MAPAANGLLATELQKVSAAHTHTDTHTELKPASLSVCLPLSPLLLLPLSIWGNIFSFFF